jgi:hypothetical protein
MDLLMLIGCHGRERTQAEFEALFAAAGFEGVTVEPAAQAFNLIAAQSTAVAAPVRR